MQSDYVSDYIPDIESQPWYTAAYPYQAPDAPEVGDCEGEEDLDG